MKLPDGVMNIPVGTCYFEVSTDGWHVANFESLAEAIIEVMHGSPATQMFIDFMERMEIGSTGYPIFAGTPMDMNEKFSRGWQTGGLQKVIRLFTPENSVGIVLRATELVEVGV